MLLEVFLFHNAEFPIRTGIYRTCADRPIFRLTPNIIVGSFSFYRRTHLPLDQLSNNIYASIVFKGFAQHYFSINITTIELLYLIMSPSNPIIYVLLLSENVVLASIVTLLL